MKIKDMHLKKYSSGQRDKNSATNYFCNYNFSSSTVIVKNEFSNSVIVDNRNHNTRYSYSSYNQENEAVILNLDSHSIRNRSVIKLNIKGESLSTHSLLIDSDKNDDIYGWENKRVESWNEMDTTNWLIGAYAKLQQAYCEMSAHLAMPGRNLLLLTEQEFIIHDKKFGKRLFEMLHQRIPHSKNIVPSFDALKLGSDDEGQKESPVDSKKSPTVVITKKRSPGRPRKLLAKKKEVRPKVWEFIRGLLLDKKYCPSWICWDDYKEKTFLFKKNNEIAKLWGSRKPGNKNTMNFEKFSRAMRYYYDKKIFEIVPNRRLVYKFGAKAKGLETDCPNFDPNYYSNLKKSS